MDSKHGNSDEESSTKPSSKQSNILPLAGNERTMNLNPLILTNIQSSHYFKEGISKIRSEIESQQTNLNCCHPSLDCKVYPGEFRYMKCALNMDKDDGSYLMSGGCGQVIA